MVRPRKRSLLYSLFIALALFVVTPVLIMVSMSDFVLMNTITDEIGKANVGKLKVAMSIDRMVDEQVQNTCVRISMDSQLNDISAVATYDALLRDSSKQYELMRYQLQLDELVRTNPVFHSIHVVLMDTDYVISSIDGTVPRSGFSDAGWLAATLRDHGADEHSTYLRPHVPGQVTGSGGHVSTVLDERVISYLYPLMPYITNLRGFVVLNINEREFSRRINSSNYGSEGSIAALDSQGNVISDVDRRRVGQWMGGEAFFRRASAETGSEGYFVLPGRDSDHLITWLRPDGGGRVFVGDFSLGELTRNVGNIRLQTVLISLGVVAVGLLLSYFVSLRFFNPVRKLIQEIQERTGSDPAGELNEVTLLSSAFDTLIKRENQLFSSLEQQRRYQKDEWVRHAIEGQLGGERARDRPEQLTGTQLMAALLTIDGYEAWCARVALAQREFSRSLLLHMAEEAFRPELGCVGSLADEHGVILILASDCADSGSLADALDTGFGALNGEAAKLLQTTVSFFVGSRSPELEGLAASWTAAKLLVNQRFLQGPAQWYWAENTIESGLTSFYPRRAEHRILAAMAAGNRSEAASGLQSLVQSIRDRPGLSYDNVILILNQLVGGIIKQLIELNISITELFGADYHFYGALSRTETLDEAESWLLGVLETVMSYQARDSRPDSNHVRSMIEYIRANLRHDFGIEAVAEQVGLSYSHARKLFQDELGDSIVNYTNTLRIAEAQRLLRDTGERLEEIATSIGYNNSQSFNRYFKKFVGMTPGEYRSKQTGQA